jgi:hypothetical protein
MTTAPAASPDFLIDWRAAHSATEQWLGSNFTDSGALGRLVDALRRLLVRSPEQAGEVLKLALSTTTVLRVRGESEALGQVARIGLDAALIQDGEADPVQVALLALAAAEAMDDLGDPHGSTAAMRFAEESAARLPEEDALRSYVHLCLAAYGAASLEAVLETEQAARVYTEALAEADSLLVDGRPGKELIAKVLTALYGDVSAVLPDGEGLAQEHLTGQLHDLVVGATLGLARCGLEPGGATDGVPAGEALALCAELGIPHGTHPFDLRELVIALPPEEAVEAVEALLAAAGDEPWIADPKGWTAVLRAAEARSRARAGDLAGAQERIALAMSATFETSEALTWAVVTADAMLIDSKRSGSFTQGLVDGFLTAYGGLGVAHQPRARQMRIKAAFDEPIGALTAWAAERYEADSETSPFLSLVIDAERRPEHTPVRPATVPSSYPEDERARSALRYATDTLRRIQVALAASSDAAVLVVQPLGDESLFVAVTGSELRVTLGGSGYARAAAELVEAMRDDLDAVLDGFELGGDGAVDAAGRRAYAEIPATIRGVLDEREVLLVVPDFKAEASGMPYELLHDGSGFLGERKLVARFGSLAALARELELPAAGTQAQRALVVAADHVRGYPELLFAAPETEAIRAILGEANWDAPDLRAEELDTKLVLTGGELASLVHLAGHGDAVAGEEALLLSDTERLTVSEIERRPLPRLALSFVNACSLGRTRYVGGGVSRGIANALHRAGAPTVVANTLPVEDRSASQLALAFYRHLREQPVGEALRLARLEMHAAGVAPASWGATMLIGNPSHTPGADGAVGGGEPRPWPTTFQELQEQLAGAGGEPVPDDPRASAATLLEAELATLDPAEPPSAEHLEILRQVADSLGYLAAAALVEYQAVQALEQDGAPASEVARVVGRLAPILETLEGDDEIWGRMRVEVQALAKRGRLAGGGREIRVYNAATGEETEDADAIRDVLLASQAEVETREGEVGSREPERDVDDVLWNALILGHRLKLGHTPAAVFYTRTLARKLAELGALGSGSETDAARVALGVLTFLWDRQSRTHLARELVVGGAGVLRTGIEAAAADSGPPEELSRHLGDVLDSLLAAPGGDTEALASASTETIEELLDGVAEDGPAEVALRSAWAYGAVLERNTFSAMAGSLGLERRARLERLYDGLATRAEERLSDWLVKGFEPVRSEGMGALTRWRYPPTQEEDSEPA